MSLHTKVKYQAAILKGYTILCKVLFKFVSTFSTRFLHWMQYFPTLPCEFLQFKGSVNIFQTNKWTNITAWYLLYLLVNDVFYGSSPAKSSLGLGQLLPIHMFLVLFSGLLKNLHCQQRLSDSNSYCVPGWSISILGRWFQPASSNCQKAASAWAYGTDCSSAGYPSGSHLCEFR